MVSIFEKHQSIFIKQTKKGCIQELMGCEATNEFKLFPTKDDAKSDDAMVMYSLEESSFLVRCCCQNNRSFTQTVWLGNKEAKADVVLKMERPLACAMQPCCCCSSPPFMQTMNMMNADDTKLGSNEIPCFVCVPAIKVKNADGAIDYSVQMPTCMGGMCVNVCAEGLCNCKIPFYLYPPGKRAEADIKGKVIKEWGGLVAEMFTSADKFSVEFPTDATPETKAAIWAGVMLVDYNHFEGGTDQSDSGGMGVMGGMLGAAPAPETEMMDR